MLFVLSTYPVIGAFLLLACGIAAAWIKVAGVLFKNSIGYYMAAVLLILMIAWFSVAAQVLALLLAWAAVLSAATYRRPATQVRTGDRLRAARRGRERWRPVQNDVHRARSVLQ